MKNFVHAGKTVIVFVSLFFGALLSGCDQEALFWDIAHEYPPISPDVGGRPTKIVKMGSTLYVGNNSDNVWEYNTDAEEPHWTQITDKPNFRVKDIAAANGKLFALDREGRVWKQDSGWVLFCTIKNAGNDLHRTNAVIFGAGNDLFVSELISQAALGSDSNTAFQIKRFDDVGVNDGSSSEVIISAAGKLTGAEAVGGKIYLATWGDGLYSGTGTSFSKDPQFDGVILGLTQYENKLYIVTEREVCSYDGSTRNSVGSGYNFSGAVAGWTIDGTSHLMLVGLRNGSGTYGIGYREILINPADGTLISGLEVPGEEAVSSIDHESQYVSAIGAHAINYLYVCDGMTRHADAENRPVVFASTAKSGLWSYRTRNGGDPQWNGEDRTPF